MGFLGFRSNTAELKQLPTGSFTVDSDGEIITSTVPISFPKEELKRIALLVLNTFRQGHEVGQPFAELIVHFAAFKLTARELRGGAIIFLAPVKRA